MGNEEEQRAELSQRFKALLEKWFVELTPAYPARIYHYTSAAGLQGMVENQRLWASAAYYMNDLSEIDYGLQLVSERVKRFKERGITSGIQRFLELLASYLEGSEITRISTIYLLCFCESDNVLSQWRTY